MNVDYMGSIVGLTRSSLSGQSDRTRFSGLPERTVVGYADAERFPIASLRLSRRDYKVKIMELLLCLDIGQKINIRESRFSAVKARKRAPKLTPKSPTNEFVFSAAYMASHSTIRMTF